MDETKQKVETNTKSCSARRREVRSGEGSANNVETASRQTKSGTKCKNEINAERTANTRPLFSSFEPTQLRAVRVCSNLIAQRAIHNHENFGNMMPPAAFDPDEGLFRCSSAMLIWQVYKSF